MIRKTIHSFFGLNSLIYLLFTCCYKFACNWLYFALFYYIAFCSCNIFNNLFIDCLSFIFTEPLLYSINLFITVKIWKKYFTFYALFEWSGWIIQATHIIFNIYASLNKHVLLVAFFCILLHLYSASHRTHKSEVLPLTCLADADAVVFQSNCVWRICSRSLHSNCLGWGSNPYSPRYWPSALTDRPPWYIKH